MIYIGLRNWERAQSFFDIVVSCPTLNAISKIQVEAFKKLVLVTLLATGKVRTRAYSCPKNKIHDRS